MVRKKVVCVFCGSLWTYATDKEMVCRKCGERFPRDDLIEEYIPEEISEVEE